MKDLRRLHQNITDHERSRVIRRYPVGSIISAPGHQRLRDPEAVLAISRMLAAGGCRAMATVPILLNVFTCEEEDGCVTLRTVECIDGNHRLAGGLHSGRWRVIGDILGDIPKDMLEVRVNGWKAGGDGPEPRWVPKSVVVGTEIPWSVVKHSRAKGLTAQIPGDISSLDSRIAEQHRGVPIYDLMQAVLNRSTVSYKAGN